MAGRATATKTATNKGWSHGFCNCFADGVSGCLLGWFCPCCYMARARTRYDQSNWGFNLFCVGSDLIRSIVRDGYGLQGSCECLKCLCPPCNAIQVNAEVSTKGPSPGGNGDREWSSGLCDCCSGGAGSCMYACCCLSCYWAQTRTDYDQSGCCYNWCCVTAPAVRSIVREGYGIQGSCCGDICAACCCSVCAAIQANSEVKAQARNTRGRNKSKKKKKSGQKKSTKKATKK
mmetsp:Transcript_58528/g.96929  ORF Transcript_58528/g.96929 Transcript_58528/m.96929 type:complete len:232 (-) Transcript_58528:69-764(-)